MGKKEWEAKAKRSDRLEQRRRRRDKLEHKQNRIKETTDMGFISSVEVERIKQVVTEMAERITSRLGLELIDVEFFQGSKRWILRVTINRPSGTSIRDCEMVSRSLERRLDLLDLIPTSYVLEVQSKGIN